MKIYLLNIINIQRKSKSSKFNIPTEITIGREISMNDIR